MTTYFRIMVVGEDGLEFCYQDDIHEDDCVSFYDNAREQYPNARIYIEEHV